MEFKSILVFLFFIIASAFAQAQNLPGSIWTSPQSATTEGRYRSNADDFIRPDTHSGLKFNKWFGLTAFNWDENNNAIATLGFAVKPKDLYISAFYSGNFWAGIPANNYTERQFTAGNEPEGGAAGITYDVYSSINVASQAVNNFALLFGFADMGLRFTLRTNYKSFKESNIVVVDQLYGSYKAENGYMAPQIAWAMSKDLTDGKGVRPWVTFDLTFDRSYLETETSGADSGGNIGKKIERSANVLTPAFALGLGSYHFYNQDGFRASADLEYALSFKVYNNEYSYADENGMYQTKKFKGTNNPGNFPYVERNYFTNTLTPSVAGSWSKEKLALRFKLNLPLTLSTEEANVMALNGSVLHKEGNGDKTTTFTIRPDVRLAMQYKIIPDRLILNAGARIQASALTLETVDRKNYNSEGVKVIPLSQKIHRNSFGSSVASRFSIGPTFYFTENFWVESNTGVTNTYGDNAINVFSTGSGGLFSFGSILVCLKF